MVERSKLCVFFKSFGFVVFYKNGCLLVEDQRGSFSLRSLDMIISNDDPSYVRPLNEDPSLVRPTNENPSLVSPSKDDRAHKNPS